ncbi:MAG: hypothetical protein CM1200mP22_12350 [Dehalococcoidia bacterium]|nr:MAG: hypothetical protein CM1200mP22_12350 [Dehalococcoidia bacterium]
MIATCVTHVGVCVRDMEESLKFYRDALGMTVIGEKITDITEGGTQTARLDNYALERNTRHWVSLAYGGEPDSNFDIDQSSRRKIRRSTHTS